MKAEKPLQGENVAFNPAEILSNIIDAFRKGLDQTKLQIGFWVRGDNHMSTLVNADSLCFFQVAWNLTSKASRLA